MLPRLWGGNGHANEEECLRLRESVLGMLAVSGLQGDPATVVDRANRADGCESLVGLMWLIGLMG